MSNPIRNFLDALDKEEEVRRHILSHDNLGLILRSAINEFDWYHYNCTKVDELTSEQSEQYYILRLGIGPVNFTIKQQKETVAASCG